jgi:hypothetical protein
MTVLAAVLLAVAAPAWCRGGPSPLPAHDIIKGNQGIPAPGDDANSGSKAADEQASGDDQAAVDDSTAAPAAAGSDASQSQPLLVPLTPFESGAGGSASEGLGAAGGSVNAPAVTPSKVPLTPMTSNSKVVPPDAPAAPPAAAAAPPAVLAPVDNSGPCPEDRYERRLWRFDDTLDLSQAVMKNNPPALASWPATAHITKVSFSQGAFSFEFDKAEGSNRWPDTPNTPSMGPLQYTLGVAEYIGGQWYASAAVQYWHGRPQTAPTAFKKDWFYAPDRWGPLCYHQPIPGEEFGIFVVAGNVRNVKDDGSLSPIHERSNVVLVPMPSDGASPSFDFSSNSASAP